MTLYKKSLSIVVAYDRQRGIGVGGALPWGRSLPADLAHFKQLTTGGSIIMGRTTFESIGSRPLPQRENIVISRTPTQVHGVLTAVSLEAAVALSRYRPWIIGGGQLYRYALPYVTTIYATEVDATFPRADVFFPHLAREQWREVRRVHPPAASANTYAFDFIEYDRIND